MCSLAENLQEEHPVDDPSYQGAPQALKYLR